MKEKITLKNNARINIRIVQKGDEELLFNYFNQLSAESKSRFGPHRFDRETVMYIVKPTNDISRYIALDEQQEIIAYMLIKNGLNDGEKYRLTQNNIPFDEALFALLPLRWQMPGKAVDWDQPCLEY